MANSPWESKEWSDQKIKLRARFAILTEGDLNFAEGKKEDMLTKVQKKLGHTKAELETIITGL
ncbi:MAG: general stress protein CsbD [Bacteroidetes bacterium]|nr:general stress protein CsbD [Bacteroidota bacterium]